MVWVAKVKARRQVPRAVKADPPLSTGILLAVTKGPFMEWRRISSGRLVCLTAAIGAGGVLRLRQAKFGTYSDQHAELRHGATFPEAKKIICVYSIKRNR